MKLTAFLDQLYDRGDVLVEHGLVELDERDREESTAYLERTYHEDRLTLAGEAPPFAPEAAVWAATVLYRACQCLVQRQIPAREVRQLLQPEYPMVTPAVAYSADLTFRSLRELLRLARGLAPSDALVEALLDLGSHWPFSSTGIDHLPKLRNLGTILEHPGLLAAYADRIILAKDATRLEPPEVRSAIAGALGDHAEHYWPEYSAIVSNLKENPHA